MKAITTTCDTINRQSKDYIVGRKLRKYCCPVKCVLLLMLLKFYSRNKGNKKAKIRERISTLNFYI